MSEAVRRFFLPVGVDGYERVMPDDEDRRHLRGLGGVVRAEAWEPPPVHLLRHDVDGAVLREALVLWVNHTVVAIRDEAIGRLKPILEPHGELLLLASSEADLMIFNATRTIDALDEERSEIVRLSSGRVMAVPHLVLRSEEIPDEVHAFVLEEPRNQSLLLSEQLVEEIRDAVELDGVDFEEATRL